MEGSKILNYVTEDGETGVANVIDIFTLIDYPGKEYIVYTNGDENNPNAQLFISELVENENTFFLKYIENEKELHDVQMSIYELTEMTDNEWRI